MSDILEKMSLLERIRLLEKANNDLNERLEKLESGNTEEVNLEPKDVGRSFIGM